MSSGGIDAISASPAIRLRYTIAATKASQTPPQPVPPAVGGETLTIGHPSTSFYAFKAGDPRAILMRLREEAADEIDRLLAFLDATEGDIDLEGTDEDGDEPEHKEDTGDFEPSLGSANMFTLTNQERWSAGGDQQDREGDGDDLEPSLCGKTADCCVCDDRDLEVDLGSFDRMVDQRKSLRVADLRYQTYGGWPETHGEFDDVRAMS